MHSLLRHVWTDGDVLERCPGCWIDLVSHLPIPFFGRADASRSSAKSLIYKGECYGTCPSNSYPNKVKSGNGDECTACADPQAMTCQADGKSLSWYVPAPDRDDSSES